MAADKTVTFGIKVAADTNADSAASSVEELRKRIASSQDAIKSYSSSMRNLRGSSDEVKDAKEKLKAAVNAERESVSRATLALGKHGTTVLEVGKKLKDQAKETNNVKNAISAAGGPVAELSAKFDALTGILGGAGGAMGAFALAGAALIAVSAGIVAGFTAAAISLGKFILESGNAIRTQNLFQEAATGSASNAKAFAHQIDAIAMKVPQSRAELNELSLSLSRSLVGTRVSGQGIIDTFNAVAQTSAAMGDSAGKALEGIITRGKQMGRLSLGLNELQGTGLAFQDVATQLSKNLKISLLDAQTLLMQGRVNIDAGAKAIRDVVEKRFGAINARRMLDINVLTQKFKDTLAGLTDKVNLEPVLRGFEKLAELFSSTTVTGTALKQLITTFGNTIGKAFEAALPFITTFFNQIVIESLKLEIAFIKVDQWLQKTFGVSFTNLFGDATSAVLVAQVAFYSLAAALAVGAVAAVVLASPFILLGAALYYSAKAGKALSDFFTETDWAALGSSIIDGVVNGIVAGWDKLKGAVKATADAIKNAFKGALDMHSPSRVFAEYGRQTTEGYAQGVDSGSAKAQAAVSGMVSPPPSVSIGGGGGTNNTFEIHINVNASGSSGQEVAEALTGPSFKAQFQKVLEEMMVGMGAPTQTSRKGVT